MGSSHFVSHHESHSGKYTFAPECGHLHRFWTTNSVVGFACRERLCCNEKIRARNEFRSFAVWIVRHCYLPWVGKTNSLRGNAVTFSLFVGSGWAWNMERFEQTPTWHYKISPPDSEIFRSGKVSISRHRTGVSSDIARERNQPKRVVVAKKNYEICIY